MEAQKVVQDVGQGIVKPQKGAGGLERFFAESQKVARGSRRGFVETQKVVRELGRGFVIPQKGASRLEQVFA